MSQQAFGVGPEYSFSRNKLLLQGGEVTGETWRVVTGCRVEQAEQISRKLGQGKSEWSRQLSVTRTPADFSPERKFGTQRSVESSRTDEGRRQNSQLMPGAEQFQCSGVMDTLIAWVALPMESPARWSNMVAEGKDF